MRLFPKIVIAATLLAMVLAPGLAVAGEPATIPLDLSAAGGPALWLRCSGPTIDECGIASVWMQTNGLKGLQTTIFAHGGRPWDPDTKLTP